MGDAAKYYVVTQKAVPDVLLRVVEAKRLLESEKVPTVQEAVDAVGISRSSFISTRMTSFNFTITRREPRLPSPFRWTMNPDCYRMY